ncbi:hypothetical protein TBLA_0I00650 [Henningerozyma blattae CBS 6284]|uniref:Aldehyde dehydrogenase n=1 Tax=Henningerozyma blattae (strain ATCC 34711 / CBS 6284 / DSM 70876 / NBRC 10599 / NRRL Y-10934 / UCD 77-7) TaxID=1071380 RepID=I2H8M2_HENB6|nr:hypothetical protein TBLA_0I00650 [Tetrapisispora blattae CBS 6284]CCH62724.1 hypothetical protein TBLA_0I00650 [Tetrapisispora blattae CBS 6284]
MISLAPSTSVASTSTSTSTSTESISSSVLSFTPLDDIDIRIKRSKEYFNLKQQQLALENKSLKYEIRDRQNLLKRLYFAIKDNEELIILAMEKDFNRSRQETISLEFVKLLNDILHIIESLPKWMSNKKVNDWSPVGMFGNIQIQNIALGTVLIIAPFNFPLLLALLPVVYAISGGNSVILKPSELTPNTANIIERIVEQSQLPSGLVQIIQGGAVENTKLINSGEFDKIFYTGSPRVGAIVAEAAAKSLTPCVLELGGKSPTFFTQNLNRSHWETALKRIFFGSFANSGQICVRPDYLLVHSSIYKDVVKLATQLLHEMFPLIDSQTEFTHLINDDSYKRTTIKLKTTNSNIIQAKIDESSLQGLNLVPPTLLIDCDWDDSFMKEENFAPILPIIKYDNLDKTIDKIMTFHDTPLAEYIFSDNSTEINHILTRLRAGDCMVGDTIIHVGVPDTPFGGIGTSGYGNYGGNYGFSAFTHERTVFKQPYWMDLALSMRYPPYSITKRQLAQIATERKPWFDRDGNDKFPLWKAILIPIGLIMVSLLTKKYISS